MRFVPFMCASLSARSVVLILAVSLFAQPAAAGMEDAVKALQSGDVVAAEKELQALAKERDPRAQFFLGLYIYGNPDSKLFDLTKGAPLLLDAAAGLVAAGHRDREALRNAVVADLDRAADRHFDEFQRNLHTVAAIRAVQQVLA